MTKEMAGIRSQWRVHVRDMNLAGERPHCLSSPVWIGFLECVHHIFFAYECKAYTNQWIFEDEKMFTNHFIVRGVYPTVLTMTQKYLTRSFSHFQADFKGI